jgi:hypothetical protein
MLFSFIIKYTYISCDSQIYFKKKKIGICGSLKNFPIWETGCDMGDGRYKYILVEGLYLYSI